MKTTEKFPKPSNGSLICTFGDCPDRNEYLKTRDEVLAGSDWKSGLCPNTCPMSLRNSDYSKCKNTTILPTTLPACKLGGSPVGTCFGHIKWCEACVINKKCPRGFVR